MKLVIKCVICMLFKWRTVVSSRGIPLLMWHGPVSTTDGGGLGGRMLQGWGTNKVPKPRNELWFHQFPLVWHGIKVQPGLVAKVHSGCTLYALNLATFQAHTCRTSVCSLLIGCRSCTVGIKGPLILVWGLGFELLSWAHHPKPHLWSIPHQGQNRPEIYLPEETHFLMFYTSSVSMQNLIIINCILNLTLLGA